MVVVGSQFPYRDINVIFQIFLLSIVTRPLWPIRKHLDFSFICGHYHMNLVDNWPLRWLLYFLLVRQCWHKQVKTAVHSCISAFSSGSMMPLSRYITIAYRARGFFFGSSQRATLGIAWQTKQWPGNWQIQQRYLQFKFVFICGIALCCVHLGFWLMIIINNISTTETLMWLIICRNFHPHCALSAWQCSAAKSPYHI